MTTYAVVVHREGKLLRAFGPFTQNKARVERQRLLKMAEEDYPGVTFRIQTCKLWPQVTQYFPPSLDNAG